MKKRETKIGGKMSFLLKRKMVSLGVLVCLMAVGGYFIYQQHYSADTVVVGQKNVFSKRYIYWRGQVSDASQRTRLLNIMTRGAAAGYNGVVLEDFDAVYNWDTAAKNNLNARAEVTTKAQSLGMAVIPFHKMDNGLAEGITKNIVESFPVVDTKFLVSGTTARATTSPAITIPNAGFESWTSSTQPANWSATAATQSSVAHSGTYSAMLNGANAGEVWSIRDATNLISVDPHKVYEATFWLKTANVTKPNNTLRFTVHGYDATGASSSERYSLYRKEATFVPSGTLATKDWTQYKITFNSLDKVKLRFTFGAEDTSGGDGTWYLDDLSMQEVGLRNTVRRETLPVADQLPIVVKSSDGATTYTEGTDYIVGAELLTIPAGSRITSGQTIKVSWYQKAEAIARGPEESVCHDLYLNNLNTDVGHLAQQVYPSADGFFINIDEQGYGNWDPSCKRYNTANPGQDMTGAQYIAFMLQKNIDAYQQKKPGTPLYVWNDMFDDYHNAQANYLVYNGNLAGSVASVPTNVEIVNWNSLRNTTWGAGALVPPPNGHTQTYNSLKFFGDKGYHQTYAGYYDTGNTSNDQFFLTELTSLENSTGINNVDGYMYTSWNGTNTSDGGSGYGDFTQLENVANLFKAAGRWGGTTPPPPPTDTTPPVLSAGAPSGTLATGTTTSTLSVTTSENATCKYGTTAGAAYSTLPNTFATTGALSHSSPLSGLTNGTAYTYYVRCQDAAGNVDTSDYAIAFSVAPASVGSCTDTTKFKGEYFANVTLAGSPALVRCDDAVNFNWGSAAPATGLPVDLFSARWTKTLNFTAGTYTFTTVSDDGVKLWLDGNLLIDNWTDHSQTTDTNTLAVTAGNHIVKMEYYDNAGGAAAQLSWAVNAPDTIAPTGSISIQGSASSTTAKSVTLNLNATDNTGGSGMGTMRFSNNGSNWSAWTNYATTYSWNIASGYGAPRGYGTKTTYVQFKDNSGNISGSYSDTISYVKR